MRNIKFIVVHCAATPNGRDVLPESLDQWHAKRGFKRSPANVAAYNSDLPHIGYHFIVCVDGTLKTGRHIEEVGAHVQGSNANSIGICMIGTDKFTPEQWVTLRELHEEFDITCPGAIWKGHRDFSPDQDGDGVIEPWEWLKTCPGFDVTAWVNSGFAPNEENIF